MKDREDLFFYINVDHGHILNIFLVFSVEIDSDIAHAKKLFDRYFKLQKKHADMEMKIIQEFLSKISNRVIERIKIDHGKIKKASLELETFFKNNKYRIEHSSLRREVDLIDFKKIVSFLRNIQKKHIDYEDKYFYPIIVKKISPRLRSKCIKEIKARI